MGFIGVFITGHKVFVDLAITIVVLLVAVFLCGCGGVAKPAHGSSTYGFSKAGSRRRDAIFAGFAGGEPIVNQPVAIVVDAVTVFFFRVQSRARAPSAERVTGLSAETGAKRSASGARPLVSSGVQGTRAAVVGG